MNLTSKISRRLHSLFRWLFGPRCCMCGYRGAYRQRMNTRYENEEQNWTIQCDQCMESTEEYWQSMWEDYYRGCM